MEDYKKKQTCSVSISVPNINSKIEPTSSSIQVINIGKFEQMSNNSNIKLGEAGVAGPLHR